MGQKNSTCSWCCRPPIRRTSPNVINSRVSSSSSYYTPHSVPEETDEAVNVVGSSTEEYCFRPRLPSFIDVTTHKADNWWSDAHHDRSEIVADLGPNPPLLSKLLCVRTSMTSQYDPLNLMDYFDDFKPTSEGRCFVIYQMRLNGVLLNALYEVTDQPRFDEWLGTQPTSDILHQKLKLITCPANLPVRLPLKGPKSAETIADYFGDANVRFSCHRSNNTFVCISVDIFSKWIIRKLLPSVAFTLGRICDFILLDTTSNVVVCGLRVVCTPLAINVLRPVT